MLGALNPVSGDNTHVRIQDVCLFIFFSDLYVRRCWRSLGGGSRRERLKATPKRPSKKPRRQSPDRA